jgi:hypothetical protein
MFDKVLVLGGILLGSILVIENMVTWMIWYLFLDPAANSWVIVLVSIIIWIAIGYWTRNWLIDSNKEEEYDDYNF